MKSLLKNNQTQKAGLRIVRLLKKQGFTAFWVGGTVRDLILGRESDNLDIATDALPQQVELLLSKQKIHSKPVGKKYGTILAILGKNPIEITTFRKESRYSDARHPDRIEFIADYKLDAKRRDFTVNALYLDPESNELLDEVGGLKDIKGRLIKFVGNPKHRIDEDHLRMLRAVRFATQLKFKLEKNTFAAIKTRAKLISGVSGERVKQELDKILLSENRIAGIRLLDRIGLLRFIIPELEALSKVFHGSKQYHLEGSVFEHTLKVLDHLPLNLDLAYAGLFHDIGKIENSGKKIKNGELITSFFGHQGRSEILFRQYAAKLKFSARSRDRIAWLIKHHDDRIIYPDMKPLKKLRYLLHEDIEQLLELWNADSAGNLRKSENNVVMPGNSKSYHSAKNLLVEVKQKRKITERLAKGKYVLDITKMNPGPAIGKIISQLTDKILLGEIKNKPDAESFLKKFRKNA